MSRLLMTFAALGALCACASAETPPATSAAASIPAAALVASEAAPAASAATAEAPPLAGGPAVEPATAPAIPVRVAAVEPLRCDIRATRSGGVVAIEATAHARTPVQGDYQLVITKDGPGGSSDVSQGGAFDLRSGETATLSGTELSLEPHSGYRAHLVLSDGGETLCSADRRS